MDTGRIKQFATESRRILKEGVMQRIRALGFDSEGNTPDMPERVQGGTRYQGRLIENERFYDCWVALNKRIHELGKNGVQQVYEEAAYTWFNRLVAIRIMQKNDFIESVLSYDVADIRVPHIVSEARKGRLMVSLTDEEDRRLRMLLMDDTKTQEQFALLITAYCRETPFISKCFGGIDLYLELLLPDDILSANRFIDLLNHTDEYITDEQFRSAELIGWLYQFYISERKDEVFASFKKGKKAEAEDIPAATQIFTPNWIVKYMVQNTVGRIYLDNNPYCPLKKDWRYLVEPTEPTPKDAILRIDDLEELTLADLACGSGHILVEGFDLFYGLYIDEGYSRHDAVVKILTKNLTGVDLDTRAKQLATFALLLKAAQIDKSFLDGKVMPRVLDMPNVDRYTWRDLNGHMCCALQIQCADEKVFKELDECFDLMKDAHNLGSIMKFNVSEGTRDFVKKCIDEQNRQHQFEEAFTELFRGFDLILALSNKYSAVVMNPPYMGSGNMNTELSEYVKNNFEKGKADLCTTCMLMQEERTQENGLYANIIPPSWMFLSAFESLRRYVVETKSILSLLHLSRGVFGADFGSVSTILKNRNNSEARGTYFRLIERTFQEFDQNHLKQLFEKTISNHDFRFCFANYSKDIEEISYCENGSKIYYPNVLQRGFEEIPGYTIGYWATEKLLSAFAEDKVSDYFDVKAGLQTGDNNRFVRFWTEPSYIKIEFGHKSESTIFPRKWVSYSKGGGVRKWYGNNELVVNWGNNAHEMRETGMAIFRNESYYFKNGITWSGMSSSFTSFRLIPEGFVFDSNKGPMIFEREIGTSLLYALSLLNSIISSTVTKVINPTVSTQIGDVVRIPYIIGNSNAIEDLGGKCVAISKQDWDAHETSWDFAQNELLSIDDNTFLDIIDDYADFYGLCIDPAAPQPESLEWRYDMYKTKWNTKFMRLHQNEEELNRQFISIYDLEDELTPDVPLDEITILQQGEVSIENDEVTFHADVVMKQLISYAIGCMMGRYRLDKPGLHIAYPNPTDEDIAPYEYNGTEFHIDEDAIIPLMPKDTRFDDNAVNRLVDFIKQVLGAEKLTDNLNFIEKQLGKSLEQYLVKDYWKDHKKMYQNRPIYWLFSSKKGAFQVIAYMHRMDKYTVENIRNKYLLPHIEFLRQEIAELDSRASTLNPQERKTYVRLQKELEECQEYHDRLHTVADQQIAFDLDDGVVVNYAKFGDVVAKLK